MKRLNFALVIAMITILAGGSVPVAAAQTPASSPEVAAPVLPAMVEDADGNDVEITDVSRIIAMNGNVTETIFALGLGANVVATDVSALYPPEAVALPKIGYQRQLSVEGILSFDPTLVIGTTDAGPPEAIDQLRAAGVTVLILPLTNSADGAIQEIRTVGATLGLPVAANAIADNVSSSIAEAQSLSASIDPKARVAFLYVRGEGTQLLSGSDTQADAVINAAGATNVGAEIGIHGYQPITPEALAQAAPDVIVVLRLGLESVGGVDGLLAIPGVAQTPAGESRHIVVFDDLYLLGFGPRFGDAIYDLTLALYPDLPGETRHPEWQGES